MSLDPATLGTVAIVLSALMGLLLLFSWSQSRTVVALWWWGIGFFVGASGVGVLGLQNLSPPVGSGTVALGNALIVLGLGCKYCGFRQFNGRPTRPYLAFMGALVWFGVWRLAIPDYALRLNLTATLAAIYLLLCCWELARHASERLTSQIAAAAVYGVAGSVCLVRGFFGPTLSSGLPAEVLSSGWSSGWALLVVLYIPTTAVLLMSMSTERLEYRARKSSLTDPLTQVPNRRAFFREADALATRQNTSPLSCFLFDLDNFKSVNDGHGHQAGDLMLQELAQILAENVPDGALFGRLGGEEFGALAIAEQPEAEQIAERIRSKVSDHKMLVGEEFLHVTVSIGCVTAAGLLPDELLAQADAALYEAKARGRNTVVFAKAEVQLHLGQLLSFQARRHTRSVRGNQHPDNSGP